MNHPCCAITFRDSHTHKHSFSTYCYNYYLCCWICGYRALFPHILRLVTTHLEFVSRLCQFNSVLFYSVVTLFHFYFHFHFIICMLLCSFRWNSLDTTSEGRKKNWLKTKYKSDDTDWTKLKTKCWLNYFKHKQKQSFFSAFGLSNWQKWSIFRLRFSF